MNATLLVLSNNFALIILWTSTHNIICQPPGTVLQATEELFNYTMIVNHRLTDSWPISYVSTLIPIKLTIPYSGKLKLNFRGSVGSENFMEKTFTDCLKRKWVRHAPKFREENFRGWLSNLEIRESFSLENFPLYSY